MRDSGGLSCRIPSSCCWPRGCYNSRRGALVRGGTGDGVSVQLSVDVDQDARVTGAVRAREADASGGSASTTSDVDLVTAHVELSTAGGTGDVEGDNLRTKEILARGNIRRNSETPVPAVIIEDFSPPVVGVAGWHANLGDLEPAETREGSSSIRDFRHVDVDWAVVVSADSFV